MLRTLLLTGAACCPLIAYAQDAAPVQAQADGQSGGSADTGGLGDIVVTAQRREQRLQDVPVAVSAFNSEALAARNITSLSGVEGLAPNVKFTSAAGYQSYSAVAIRGAYELNTAPFYDQPTGVYIDGVFIGKAQGSIFDIADIASIEILRGPQGTLFGRNTLAGAVNITTRKPSGNLQGTFEAGVGSFGLHRVRASVDLPRVGPLSVNVSGLITARDGYFKNRSTPYGSASSILPLQPATTDDFNAAKSASFRVAAKLDLADNLTANYSFDYSRVRNRPGMAQLTRIGEGGIFDPASASYVGVPIYLYVRPDRVKTGYYNGSVNNQELHDDVNTYGHALTIDWDLGGASVKSISAYRHQRYSNALDLDGTPYPLASAALDSRYKSFSQELQLTGKIGDTINYTGGVYYFWDDGAVTDNPFQAFGGAPSISRYGFGTSAFAVYGQADWSPAALEGLTVTLGGRYSTERKDTDRVFAANDIAPISYIIPPGTTAAKRFNSFTPTAILSYKINRDVNVYAKYAKGFKSGGFGGEAATIEEAVRPFQPETVDTFEVGLKSELFDRRLRLNLAAFWNERKDMQLSVFTGFVGGLAQTSIRNAGAARVRGFEAEMLARPVDWFTLQASLGYLDGKFKTLLEANPADPSGPPINVADDREFPVVPRWTWSLSPDVRLATFGDAELHLIVDYSHSARSFQGAYDPATARAAPLDGYDVVDARLRLSDVALNGTKVALSAWMKNITNEKYRVGGFDFGQAFGNLTVGYFNPPRTFGADATISF
ncbi:TonB-dependent receptor domain-containing protein [Sphingobium sp. WCS2017Hpa-17]|uniref:TonB-dependent receptor n=1 Tax=Sphingobium sp. WCS2017Hpa-17 TaxID=3073638 RepID=UPI0028890337|nr:TonB-dependent receptor [Sphingobium sp. WCS2017Hpa-17]